MSPSQQEEHQEDKMIEEEMNENQDDVSNTPETEEPILSEDVILDMPDNAEQRIAELEEALLDMKDKALRAMAEADNTRKRAEKERADASKFAISRFARELLTVTDNLHRAIDAVSEEARAKDETLENIMVGVESTERELLRAFESCGIKKVDPMDEKFDPNFHEVMFETDMPDKEPGTIIQVMEAGYMIHDRLLRPARVGVAKGGVKASDSHINEEV